MENSKSIYFYLLLFLLFLFCGKISKSTKKQKKDPNKRKRKGGKRNFKRDISQLLLERERYGVGGTGEEKGKVPLNQIFKTIFNFETQQVQILAIFCFSKGK
jgi:hypothetical protein